MNSVEYGNELEEYVEELLNEVIEVTRRNSSGGPGMPEDSDLRTNSLQIECKRRDMNRPDYYISGISIKKAWIEKLEKRCRISGKVPMIITSSKSLKESTWVHMKIDDFIECVDIKRI